jgi:hypothetical protein
VEGKKGGREMIPHKEENRREKHEEENKVENRAGGLGKECVGLLRGG